MPLRAFLALAVALAGCGLAVADPGASRPQPGPPSPPTDIAVRIVDRRAVAMEVCWTAGAEGRMRYDLRVARSAITPQTFAGAQDAAQLGGGPWPFPCHAPNYSPAPPGPDCRVAAGSQVPEGDGRHASGLSGAAGLPPVTTQKGERACYIVRGLYPETGYWFAVVAIPDDLVAQEPTS